VRDGPHSRCRAGSQRAILHRHLQVASKLLRDRANDGSNLFVQFEPASTPGPVGKYQVP